jgi:hypothetical protein
MTIKDVIKFLPLDGELKLQILRTYDYMDPAQKLAISRVAWNTYYQLKQTQVDLEIGKQLGKVKQGQAHLGPDFYEEVLKNTDQEINKELSNSSGAVDLATARQAMQQIMKEIQDAKAEKKAHSAAKKN